jgi:lantibiotic biosynthesis protein
MTNYSIKTFPQYVLRTPSFKLQNYLDLINDYSLEKALQQLENPFFKEAIRLASPQLLVLLDKLKENHTTYSAEKKEALEITLTKYMARISSRCTPFGLFAGCNVGDFSAETNITLKSHHEFERVTQFDMLFWIGLLQKIESKKEFTQTLRFFPNNSIYSFGDFYRYINYKYENKKREHSIHALRKSPLLEALIENIKEGSTITEMIALLADDDSEKQEALAFVDQLIDLQFLVSELEAGVNDNHEWDKVNKAISHQPDENEELAGLLNDLQNELKNIDQALFATEKGYQHIKNHIAKADFDYDEKYLFQADLNTKTTQNRLNKETAKKIQDALYFLNGIQKKRQPLVLENFKKAFLKRYETREMPLTTVMDTEIGIGYNQNLEVNDSHPLLHKFSFGNKPKASKEERWSELDFILEKKLRHAKEENQMEITLSEKDFPYFDSNWENAPATFSVITEIIKSNNTEIVAVESSGNTSASKLLGRFCCTNDAIYDLTKQITEKEEAYHQNKIVAEIIHIPESRTGNILRRTQLRKYEIPYLANSNKKKEFQINSDDLMISIRNNKILLRSKKHNKEVIPILSSAHDYSFNSLPIYHFLCDLQFQGIKPINNFEWGVLESHHNFLPRVYFKDIIISKAKWTVTEEELKEIQRQKESLYLSFSAWRKKRNIPQMVNWANHDNTLLLDLDKEICIRMLLSSVKSYAKITIEEFLFTEDSVVKNAEGEKFTNQVIVLFHKERTA